MGAAAYDKHIVKYPEEDWCHLPEEVGLVPGHGGWWRLADAPAKTSLVLRLGHPNAPGSR